MGTGNIDGDELAWTAGYFEAQAQFYVSRQGKPTILLKIRSVEEPQMRRCAEALGRRLRGPLRVPGGRPRWEITASGKSAHEVMRQLWPWLTRDIKIRYQNLRREIKE